MELMSEVRCEVQRANLTSDPQVVASYQEKAARAFERAVSVAKTDKEAAKALIKWGRSSTLGRTITARCPLQKRLPHGRGRAGTEPAGQGRARDARGLHA